MRPTAILWSLSDLEEKKRYNFCISSSNNQNTVFEFTYNWGKTEYNLGNAHAYTELKVSSVEDVHKKLEAAGAKIIEKSEGSIWCTDPDGYTLKVSSE